MSQEQEKYYYTDFETGKVHSTRAQFAGWIPSTRPLNVPYAIFIRKSDELVIPHYCLTSETCQRLETDEIRNILKEQQIFKG